MFSGRRVSHAEVKWARQPDGVFQPSDDSFTGIKWLYRYVSLVQCVDLFENARLTLSDPESWPDKYEGAWVHQLCGPTRPLKRAKIRAACFTIDPFSESFWRIYARVSPVIRLRFNLHELSNSLGGYVDDKAKTFIAPVKYVRAEKIEQSLRLLATSKNRGKAAEAARFLLKKRAAFMHEAEVRVLRITNRSVEKFHPVPVNVHRIVDQVVIDPYSEQWMETVITKLIRERYKFRGDVHRSTLDRAPNLNSVDLPGGEQT